MKLLYIGAWSDIAVVSFFPTTKKFIFVDTQPRNEFDDDFPIEESLYERPYFLKQVFEAVNKENFNFVSEKVLKVYSENELKNPTLYKFKSETQEIDYYVSSNFRKDDLPELIDEIKTSEGIIVSGYFPHSDLFNLMKPNINVYLMSETCYEKIDFNETGEDENNIINYLYDNDTQMKIYFVEKYKNKFISLSKMSEIKNIEVKQ